MPARSIKVWNGSTSQWEDVAVAAPDTSSLISNSLVNAKGDLVTATANDTPAVLTVGANDTVLTADSSTATGLAWKAASGGISNTLLDAKGDLIAASSNDTAARVAVGSNGQMLMADSSATAGLRYVDPPANRNLIINGAMQVAQRGTSSTSLTTGGYYTADRWQLSVSALGTWTQSVEADAPTGSGFNNSLKMLCTTADAAPSASDFILLNQRLEGQDVQRIRKGTSDAQQLTVSFWVKSNVTGTYVVQLEDTDNSRSVSATYSVANSATWERKVVTFPADTTGAFANDNGLSLMLQFWLAAGSNWSSGTMNTTWASQVSANRAVGQTNLAAATNNYWQITGVQLETGPVATPFEFEPFEATLRKCQRYYYEADGSGNAYEAFGVAQATSATKCWLPIRHPVVMRATPTFSLSAATDFYALNSTGTSGFEASAIALNGASTRAAYLELTVASGLTAGHATVIQADNTTAARFKFSSEL